jgi:four helix bundle protein
MKKDETDLRERTKDFALRILRMFSAFPKTTEAQVLGKQVLRSGTSIGASYREAHRARSKAEFIAKCGDSLREIEETAYWLELLVESRLVPTEKAATFTSGMRRTHRDLRDDPEAIKTIMIPLLNSSFLLLPSLAVARVTICTIQRLYAMLRGEELNEDIDEKSGFEITAADQRQTDSQYNAAIPIETFDFISAAAASCEGSRG